jgi:hypothetical protein
LTWRNIHDSPQITAITIARPTIVRTMLPPEPLGWGTPDPPGRLRGVFSPVAAAEEPAFAPVAVPLFAIAAAGQAAASRQGPRTAVAVATARESGFNLVIEGRLRGRVARVIGRERRLFT